MKKLSKQLLFMPLLMMATAGQAADMISQCATEQKVGYMKCPGATDCALTKHDITDGIFKWNDEEYQADIQVSIDSTSCTGFGRFGEPTQLYVVADGLKLPDDRWPDTTINLGTKETINIRGSGPVRLFDKRPEWTLEFNAGSFCDIKVTCTDALTVSTINIWLTKLNTFLEELDSNRIFVEKESLLTSYWNIYVDPRSDKTLLREEANYLIDFGDENDKKVGEQINAMLKGVDRAAVFKPFTDRKNRITKQEQELDLLERKFRWAKGKSTVSIDGALERIGKSRPKPNP